MNLYDIVYTPLDLPPCPKIDLGKLDSWIESVYPQTELLKQSGNKLIAGTNQKDEFPWKVVWAKALEWKNNFDKLFPEIVNYVVNDWGIPDQDILALTLLPKRISDQSKGFWHSDLDKLGLRFYIDFEDTVTDKLIFRKTLTNKIEDKNLFRVFKTSSGIENKTHTAGIIDHRQPYYLNNYLAAHSVENTTDKRRIAVIIATNYEIGANVELKKKIDNLVINSALKFHNQAIFWNDWSDGIGI